MSTTAIVVYCPTCDGFTKTAVQDGKVGTHGCMGCGGLMEVYVAQGSREAVQWHGDKNALAAAMRRVCSVILIACRLGEPPLFDGEFFDRGFQGEERDEMRAALGEQDWTVLTSMRLKGYRTGVIVSPDDAAAQGSTTTEGDA